MSSPGWSWGPDENLTLSDAELERCEPVSGEGGKALRARCPFHGSDHQRSLRVNLETGHFKCHACQVWGYLESARERRRNNAQVPYGARPGPRCRVAYAGRLGDAERDMTLEQVALAGTSWQGVAVSGHQLRELRAWRRGRGR